MILDRKSSPAIYPLSSLPKIDTDGIELPYGLKAYLVEGGTEDIVKIDVVFDAGTSREPLPLLANTCQAMLKEGTTNFSAKQISETLDYYGARLNANLSKDFCEVSLLCQTAHLGKVIDIMADVLTQAAFPEKELEMYKKRAKSNLAVNLQKVQFKCRKLFTSTLFEGTTYEDQISLEAFDDIDTSALQNFFQLQYHLPSARIFASGKDTSLAANKLAEALHGKWSMSKPESKKAIDWEFEPKEVFEEHEGAIQTAIRMGTKVIDRGHPDFTALFVANTILGGYFGSRLMQNIREEKGYTYGIGSGLGHLTYASYFFISTEVGAHVTKSTLSEIKKELNRMCTELVAIEELTLVRNYISGTLVQGFDGPFSVVGQLKLLIQFGLDSSFYQRLTAEMYAVTAEDILRVSRKYLDPNLMTTTVVGKWS
jgi:predicted Zn-dependent peptidase